MLFHAFFVRVWQNCHLLCLACREMEFIASIDSMVALHGPFVRDSRSHRKCGDVSALRSLFYSEVADSGDDSRPTRDLPRVSLIGGFRSPAVDSGCRAYYSLMRGPTGQRPLAREYKLELGSRESKQCWIRDDGTRCSFRKEVQAGDDEAHKTCALCEVGEEMFEETLHMATAHLACRGN